jgi:regulator of replication initiation timing
LAEGWKMKTIKDVRKWLTQLEQSIEDRRFLEQLIQMQIITRNIERDLNDLRDQRNKLLSENKELREEIASLKKQLPLSDSR